MLTSRVLLSLIILALSAVDATPLSRRTGKHTLALASRINVGGTQNLADKDRARVQRMKQASQLRKRDTSCDIVNSGVSFTAEVGIGDPVTNYTLLIDTGSANTFVGADPKKPYVPTKNSRNTGDSVSASYGSGNWTGEEWIDIVTLAPDLVINEQSIGVASNASGFSDVDGILGVGPVDLTNGTVNDTSTVPTILNNLHSLGEISKEVLGVYFTPSSESSSTGELTFGGYDDTRITSVLNYAPITTTSPASEYWGIDLSISYGDALLLPTTAGIVDTGTTLTLIATDAFEQYKDVTGGVMDTTTGLLSITPTQYDNLETLQFHVGNSTYELFPNAQIWPRSLNTAIGGNASAIYLVISDIGSKSGSGLDFTNGYTFLERFYSVYDTTNQQVGFATTAYTSATSN